MPENEVDAWFRASEHPMKDVMLAVRSAILEADERVEETIKWKTPTFSFKGNIASINSQAKRFVSLMFHRGADIPGEFPSFSGEGNVARYMQFEDIADVEAKSDELARAVRGWCELKAGGSKA
jgi:hypothetical protein